MQKNGVSTVVVLESSCCRMADQFDVETAMTVLALVSEDPASWDELQSLWDRYRTPAVCEFFSGLPFEECDREKAIEALLAAEAWIAIDLEKKRVCVGGVFQQVGREAIFALDVDEQGRQHFPLNVHLPPWWELQEGVAPSGVNEPRQSPINKPKVDRDLLFGDRFLAAIAAKVLETVASDDWRKQVAGDDESTRHPFTVAVHRDWLMTPRDDLEGRMPRELLHGAIEWSDGVTWGQRLRFENGGRMVALPDDWDGFATAPMGSQEMCIYYDLCREVIQAGWSWCESDEGKLAIQERESALEQLTAVLRDVQNQWLNRPYGGAGSRPTFIIECDRRRVPRGAGVVIEGIGDVQPAEHHAGCDCPICEMEADGLFGVGFARIDGYHLELDAEFAFSMHETREAWEEDQREFEAFSAEVDRKIAQREAFQTEDPLASPWDGIGEDRSIPGDENGTIKLGFMVGQIVAELHRLDADRNVIKTLNEAFADFRRTDDERRTRFASRLIDVLQSVGDQHPELISRSADLQSRINEVA